MGLILCEFYSIFSTHHERIQTLSELKRLKLVPSEIRLNYPLEAQIMIILVDTDPNKRPSAEELMKLDILLEWENETKQPEQKNDEMMQVSIFKKTSSAPEPKRYD